MKFTAVVLLAIVLSSPGWGQCPTANFNAPVSVCINESVYLQNSTVGATSYQWDFCSGDLVSPPVPAVAATNQTIFRARSFRLVQSSSGWYGFAIDQNYFLVRMAFGNNPANFPTLTTVGNPASAIQFALDLRFWQEGPNWFALVANTSANNILLLNFAADLTSTPTVTNLGSLGGLVKGPSGIDIVKEGNNLFAFVTNATAPEVLRLDFGSSITNAPMPNVISMPGATSLRGISLTKECDRWFGLATDNGTNQLYYLDFATGIQNTPTTGVLAIPSAAYSSPGGISVVNEGGNYVAFIQSVFPSNLYRVDFGPSIIDQTGTYADLGNLNINTAAPNAQFNGAFDIVSTGTSWTGYSIDLSGPGGVGNLVQLNFPNPCSANATTSSLTSPVITYNASGTYRVSLAATDAAGGRSYSSRTINVGSGTAPDITFSTQNVCVNNNVNFSSVNTSGNVIAYHWSFGDGGIASGSTASHSYTSAGGFTPSLIVDASNGCSNQFQNFLQIYNQPLANFTLPAAAPVCTNQPYLLSNASTFDAASNPSWEWRVNGSLVSIQQNLQTTFSAPVAQNIRLKALIPGCENEIIKIIPTVTPGPAVSFSVNDNCQGTSVSFTNSTMGADAGYGWTFGDGTSSSLTSPTHIYSSSATFQATLTGSNSLGCQNFQTKPVKIYSLPQPDFSVSLPPFSCNNSPTPFQNNTAPLTDSNITTWNWQFGDAAGGTSQQQNPSYSFPAAGNFNVRLSAVSDVGCSGSVTKPVIISLSPIADFTVGPSCLNASTKFTDLSSGGIQSRVWQIGASSFGVPNPTYTFTSTGSFNATLNVTGTNGCSNVKTKSIKVPLPPVLNFSVTNPCAGKNTIFSDVTSTPVDGIVGWNWNFAGNSSTGNPAENKFDTQGTYNVKLTTTHASGCKYTVSKNVLINASPIASFVASPDRGAPPLTVQFENTSQQAVNYAWKFYDKVIATSTRISPVYTFASLGDYSAELTATSAQGCSDVRTVPIKVLVPSMDLILKDFSLVNDPVTGKLKASVTILNNSNVPVSSVEIILFLSDKAVVNETIVLNLKPNQSVTKTLSFSLSPNQFDFSFLCAEINSEKDLQPDNNKRCINLSNADYFFGPYPNPTTGTLRVDWISEKPGVTRLIVYDTMGKKSYEWETSSQSGLNQASLDLEFLSTGLYYLTIETSGSKKTTRFLRQ